MNAVPEAVFKKDKAGMSLMDREAHAPLLRDLERVALSANIPAQMIWTSMNGLCSDKEIEYVRGIRRENTACGLVYAGKGPKAKVPTRMMVIAGTLIRNYINAKVMTLQDVFHAMREGQMPRPTVLLIPNFYAGNMDVKTWQVGLLVDMLYSRMNQGLHTFVYVSDMAEMRSKYTEAVHNHVVANFTQVKV